jgi:arylsulfatase A-like enzyme
VLAEPIAGRRGNFRTAETAILAFERQAVQFVAARQARLSVLELSVVDLAARESGARSSDYARASLEADRLVGQLADGLNLWTTTLVVTSDHGQADQPGVPLVMAGRGIRSGVVGAARQIDVAPTIAGLLGLPVPAASQGRALVEAFDTIPTRRWPC